MSVGDTVNIDTGSDAETRKIASVGTAASAPLPLWQPLPDGPVITVTAGSTSVPFTAPGGGRGGSVPTGEDSTFSFLAGTDASKTYTFGVEQTYSDGSIVNWSGPESSDAPAPTIEAKASCTWKRHPVTASEHCARLARGRSARARGAAASAPAGSRDCLGRFSG